jgi:hypothetical protein
MVGATAAVEAVSFVAIAVPVFSSATASSAAKNHFWKRSLRPLLAH